MFTVMATEPTFGERLKELRAASGLTLSQLAERAGMHLQAVAKLEQGARPNPTWATVKALADALGVSCEEFRRTGDQLSETETPPEPPDPEPSPVRKKGKK